ncbi:MAG: hypothetical protein P8P74_17725 [Crocinitomicaceae bacterium]|nr:hypothetical protein [Crocinitomicaceae bacterium]
MKISVLFFILSAILFSCSGEYAVEDELYSYLENEFAKSSRNLEGELDTLEVLFLDEGLLQSASPEDYRNYYQNNIDQGQLIPLQNPHLRTIYGEVELSLDLLERAALRKYDGETYDQSKFAKISHMIDTMPRSSGQISSGTVAKAHLHFLSADDFEHPFYRANILLSLQGLYFRKYVRNEQYIRPIPKKIEY